MLRLLKPRLVLLRMAWAAGLYACLVAPWLPMADAYAAVFRAAGNIVLHALPRDVRGRLLPEAYPGVRDWHQQYDSMLLLLNERMHTRSRTPLSTRYCGFVPTAMLAALTIATPLPWRRRTHALLWGVLLMQAWVFVRLGLLFADAITHDALGVVLLPPLVRKVLTAVREVLVTSLVTTFVAPVVVWALVMFRADDHATPVGQASGARRQPRAGSRWRAMRRRRSRRSATGAEQPL